MLSVYTIVSRNHLHRARVVMADVARHLPDARRFVYLADDPAGFFAEDREPFEIVRPESFAPPRVNHLRFALPPYGFCCILKPYAALHLRRHRPDDTLVHLDSDMRLLAPPVDLLEAASGNPMVFTPHLLDPDRTGQAVLDMFSSGIINTGIFALSPAPDVDRFLNWWAGQIADPARASEENHYDQKWIALAPALFSEFHVFRHPGYNVAYWNLHERTLTQDGAHGGWQVCGQPLVVYHFSGFQPEHPDQLAGRLAAVFPVPDARWNTLGIEYAALLAEQGGDLCTRWGYQFSKFRDGKTVTAIHRAYFAKFLWPHLPAEADPFDPALQAPKPGLRSLYHADHPLIRLWRGWRTSPPIFRRSA